MNQRNINKFRSIEIMKNLKTYLFYTKIALNEMLILDEFDSGILFSPLQHKHDVCLYI